MLVSRWLFSWQLLEPPCPCPVPDLGRVAGPLVDARMLLHACMQPAWVLPLLLSPLPTCPGGDLWQLAWGQGCCCSFGCLLPTSPLTHDRRRGQGTPSMPPESCLRPGPSLGAIPTCPEQGGQGMGGRVGGLLGQVLGCLCPWCCLAGVAEGLLAKVSPCGTREAFAVTLVVTLS